MLIGFLTQTYPHEKRVSLSPEIAKRFVDLGHGVVLQGGAGLRSGFRDDAYLKAGCVIEKTVDAILKKVDLLVTVSPLDTKQQSLLRKNVVVMGMLKPFQERESFENYAKQNITTIALECVPRITRAQSMDVLSSQSNLAGYKAVVDAASLYGRAFPLMMTAAGTVPAARVLILGAGVAGLQAIATAKRLGAIVSAFDVRAAAKEQVESLGATFVCVDADESGDGGGGYAKEMSEAYKKAQHEKLAQVVKTQDIIITTALIPGKPAPLLITDDMVDSMKAGSVIIDLATESGGNCSGSKFGETVCRNDVSIVGPANIASQIAGDTSQLYARNVFNYVKTLLLNSENELHIDMDDEIVKATVLTHLGEMVHPVLMSAEAAPKKPRKKEDPKKQDQEEA